ncbi:MAG TPA: hypothetical protein VG714_04980 [Acidobacteriaceae bacterium]|nr:hypothetical protein [Acidobacteriaceae bacterium]
MARGLSSTKMYARPAHQAVEKASETTIDRFQTSDRRIRNIAMRLARRAQNRILANEANNPGGTLFCK